MVKQCLWSGVNGDGEMMMEWSDGEMMINGVE